MRRKRVADRADVMLLGDATWVGRGVVCHLVILVEIVGIDTDGKAFTDKMKRFVVCDCQIFGLLDCQVI